MNIAPGNINFDLLRAFEGLRNRRAILLLIGAHFLGFVVFAIGMSTNSVGVAVVLGLVGFFVTLFGVNAAGVVLMDAARGTPLPTIADAIYAGVASFFKIIVIVIVALVAFALYWVALYVVFLICRIPGVGPLIYAVALPAAIVLTTFVLIGYAAASCIVVPAVWEGHTLRAAIARLYAVATHRPMEVFVQLLILWLVLALISIVVFGFLTSSSFLVGGISLAALGERAGSLLGGYGGGSNWLFSFLGIKSGPGFGGGNGGETLAGYATAGLFGVAMVWILAMAAYASVFLMGINLVYLSASQGIDSSAAEAKLSRGLAQAKQKASEMQEHAKQRALELQERARQAEEQRRMAAQAAAAGVGAAGTASIEAAARCPGCGASITASDAFCGDCGHKLK